MGMTQASSVIWFIMGQCAKQKWYNASCFEQLPFCNLQRVFAVSLVAPAAQTSGEAASWRTCFYSFVRFFVVLLETTVPACFRVTFPLVLFAIFCRYASSEPQSCCVR